MKKLLFLCALSFISASYTFGQQKIKDGTSSFQNLPNKDALLELESLNKGFLNVRLELKALSDPSPLSKHTAGMMVYNTATNGEIRPGLYYNDGTRWVLLESSGEHFDIVTTLVNNEDGTYTYTSEDGTKTVIDIPGDVISQFETILNDHSVSNAIINLVKKSGGNVYYNGNSFTYVTEEGNIENINFKEIVQANETVTTLVAGADGKYTYTSEDETVTVIDIPASVVENIETIVNSGPVEINGDTFTTIEDYITHIANNVSNIEGSDFITVTGTGTTADPYVVEIKEGASNSMLITNAAGELEWATIESIVQANETVTTLVAGVDGKYTYTSEDETVTVIDIPASVVENIETIVNSGPVEINGDTFTTIEDYITHIANNVSNIEGSDFITVTGTGTTADPYVVEIKEGASNSMLITNAAGELEWATIESIVQANETVTTLVAGVDGKYTYTSEDETVTVIDIPASVVENIETIVNSGPVEINGDTFTTIEDYITHIANNVSNIEGSDFITVTGTGTTADPYVVEIKEGASNSMLITNAAGELEWATIESIVQANETVTTLVAGVDGKYTYTSEDETVTVIDIPASVVENIETIVNSGPVEINGDTFTTIEDYITHIANNVSNIEGSDFITVTGTGTTADPYVVEIKEGASNSMLITNAAGELEWATIESIVQANETVTTLVAGADGKYTYTSEDETVTVIDIPASVVENIETIVNSGPVEINGDTFTTIEDYITHIANNVSNIEGSDFITVTGTGTTADPYVVEIKEGASNSMLITNAAGELEWATIESIVQANETVTTLVAGVDGKYTYTSEDETVTVIDIPASVVENIETIVNSGPVEINGDTFTTIEDYITHIANNVSNIEGSDFITVTGTGTTADPYVVEIKEGASNSMLITNAAGELEWATIESIVQANETVTTLVAGVDGKYTYTSEDETVTVIDIPASVVENIETIVNSGPVEINGDTFTTIEDYITHIANNVSNIEGSDFITVTGTGTTADPYVVEIKEGASNSMLITNAAGELEWATIESIVQANETVTTLVAGADGKYTYTSEDETVTVIDIPASVVENIETIVNSGPVEINGDTFTTIEDYITHIANNVSNIEGSDFITVTGTGTTADPYVVEIKEGASNSMLITNAAGELEWATIESIVQANETVTTLVAGVDGKYTYTSEDETVTVIDIPASVVENIETIVNSGPVEINGDTFTTIEDYITHIANNVSNIEGSDFITVTGTGTTADPYVVEIKEGASNSMLITNAAGELEWATIESIVQANETVTTLVAGVDGKYTYTSEDETVTVIDIPASVVENIETIVNSGPVEINGDTFTTIEDYITHIANNVSNIEGSDFITVTGTGTTADPYVVEIKEGASNSMLITNAAGELEWATIESIVQANETVTTLVAGADGKYTYTSEDETVTVIDIPASVVENIETIVNSGPVEINGDTFTTIEDYITHIANNVSNIEGSDFITVTGTGTTADPYVVEIKEGASNSMLITNAAGELEWATIESIVQANETVTTLVAGADGKYTYTSEDETVTVIDIPASVVENIETIVNSGPVEINGDTFTTIEDYITHIANNVSNIEGSDFITVTGTGTTADPYVVEIKEGASNSMLITNAAGELEWATIESIVQANETVTTLVAGVDGKYTYTSEDETVTVIDIPASVVENIETIVNSGPVEINGDTFTTIEDYITHIANNVSNIEGSDFITVTGTGTTADPYVVEIKEGASNSMLITNAAGELEWATIEDIINNNINAKDLIAADADNATIEVVTGGTAAVLVETSLRVKEESITTNHIQDGTIKPEDIDDAGKNQVLSTDKDGTPVWKKEAPRFFYMPAVIFDTQATGTATRDLYKEYVNQFTGGAEGIANATYPISHGPAGTTPVQYAGGIIGSTGAPADIAVFESDELYYYVTYYDESVFENLSIDVDGKLTYTVKAGATPSSYMNIVFVIKD